MSNFSNDWKGSAKVAATTNIVLAGGCPLVVDDVTLNNHDRVLVWKQTNQAQNGVYRVQTKGTGSNGTWVRATDFNSARDISAGATVYVEAGTAYGEAYFTMTTLGKVTVGTTPVVFEQKFTSGIGAELDPMYTGEKGQPLGAATLGADGILTPAQRPPETFPGSPAAEFIAGDKTKLDTALQEELDPQLYAEKGQPNGVATLDGTGKLTAAQRVAETDPVATAMIGQANGIAPLGADSKVPAVFLPPLAITDVFTAASEVEQLALVADEGDTCTRTDLTPTLTYIHNGGTAGTMADWTLVNPPVTESDPIALGQKHQVNGIGTLDANAKQTPSEIPFGTAASTVCEGNDARLTAIASKGQVNGIAPLDAAGKVPHAHLDVLLAEVDPMYSAAEASLLVVGDKEKLDNARLWVAPVQATEAIDASKPVLYKELSANIVFTFANFSDGRTTEVVVINPGSYTVTWPVDVAWPGGVAPVQTALKVDRYRFTKVGARIYGEAFQAYILPGGGTPPPTGNGLLDGLFSYWKMDEASGVRYDHLGLYNLNDINTVASAAGKIGTGAAFVRTNGEELDLQLNGGTYPASFDHFKGHKNLTMAMWVSSPDIGEGVGYFMTSRDVYSLALGLVSRDEAGGTVGRLHLNVMGMSGLNTDVTTLIYPTTVSRGGSWHLLAFCHDADGDRIGLSVDGAVWTFAAHTGGLGIKPVGNWYIPRLGIGHDIYPPDYNGYLYRFHGTMDAVGAWQKVLSNANLTSLFNGGAALDVSAFD